MSDSTLEEAKKANEYNQAGNQWADEEPVDQEWNDVAPVEGGQYQPQAADPAQVAAVAPVVQQQQQQGGWDGMAQQPIAPGAETGGWDGNQQPPAQNGYLNSGW